MDIQVDKPPPWDLKLQAVGGQRDGVMGRWGLEGWGWVGGILTAILVTDRGGTSHFLCQRGSDDSRCSVGLCDKERSFIIPPRLHQWLRAGETGSSTRKVGKKSQFQGQEAVKGVGFSHGLKQKPASRVKHVERRLCPGYLLLSLMQQTDYVTYYDSEYESCSSRPFVCFSRWLSVCLSVCLLTLQHVMCPWEPLGNPDYPYTVSCLEVEHVKIHYI